MLLGLVIWCFVVSGSRLICSTGYKFEAISLISQPWESATREEIETRDEVVVNNNTQYCSVVRTGIGKRSLILGGEVDAGQLVGRSTTGLHSNH